MFVELINFFFLIYKSQVSPKVINVRLNVANKHALENLRVL